MNLATDDLAPTTPLSKPYRADFALHDKCFLADCFENIPKQMHVLHKHYDYLFPDYLNHSLIQYAVPP